MRWILWIDIAVFGIDQQKKKQALDDRANHDAEIAKEEAQLQATSSYENWCATKTNSGIDYFFLCLHKNLSMNFFHSSFSVFISLIVSAIFQLIFKITINRQPSALPQ